MLQAPPLSSSRPASASVKKRSRSQAILEGGEPPAAFSIAFPPGMLGAQAGGGGGGGGGGAARGAPRAVRAAQALLQRERLLDWGLVVAGAIVLIATDVAAPTQPPYILKDSLPDLSHPLRPNSVPAWSVPLLGVLLPLAAVAAYALAFRRPTEELHKLALGVLGSVAIAGSITNVLKVSVRRPRPDFAPRCWPDGKPAWRGETEWGGYPVCSGDAGEVWEGLKSFPSGHSSWSASGLGYLSWLLLDRLQPLDGGGHVGRLAAALLPALGACAVGVTRYVDYWHHCTDIMAGLALGFGVSWLVYATAQGHGGGGGFGGADAGGVALPLSLAQAMQQYGDEEDDGAQRPLLMRGGGGRGGSGGGGGAAGLGAVAASPQLPSALLPV